MTNLTLNQIAKLANDKLNQHVFEVIDNRLINTTNRFDGNDIDLTIEDCEYVSTSTGLGRTYYGQSNGYVVANDIAESYLIMIR